MQEQVAGAPLTSSMSAYEMSRAEQIRRNNAMLVSMGLLDAAAAMRPQPLKKKAPAKHKPVAEPSGQKRRSSRQQGAPAPVEMETEPEAAWTPPSATERDPFRCWWTCSTENPEGELRPPLTELQRTALTTELSADERASLDLQGGEDDAAWVGDLLRFTRAYGILGRQDLVPTGSSALALTPSHGAIRRRQDPRGILRSVSRKFP